MLLNPRKRPHVRIYIHTFTHSHTQTHRKTFGSTGDVSNDHKWGSTSGTYPSNARDTAEHPTMCRVVPTI